MGGYSRMRSRDAACPPGRRARRFLQALLALLLTVQIAPAAFAQTPAGRDARPSAGLAHLAIAGGAYPRLGNYNGLLDPSDVPAYLHDAVVIAQAPALHSGAVARLKQANPYALVLLYERTLQVDYPLIHQIYGTDIYPGWWLLRAGSTLAASVDARQTSIPVSDPALFHPYDDVLVGGESMHVLQIEGSTLIVQRGFYSRATAHAAGARIAAHYSYRIDLKNTILTGKWENRRPWSFNLSTLCPRDALGRTWDDFLAEHLAALLRQPGLDGVFFDNTDELLRDPAVDVDNDNQPDGGIVDGRNVWHDGEISLFSWLHALAPHVLIMDNGTLDAGSTSNGREMEDFPLSGGLYPPAMSDYAYWQQHDAAPALDLVNPDSGHSPRFDLAQMRFGLASALLGDGYYTYDEGWHKHGAVWNFDEYDDGAGTALLADVGASDTRLPVRRSAIFHPGDIALIGREQVQVLDTAPGVLVVQRGVNGSRATSHPLDVVVATPAQIDAGSGYLGAALGPTIPVLPDPQGTNLVQDGDFVHAGPWSLHTALQPSTVGSALVQTGVLRSWESGAIDPTAVSSGLRAEQGYAVDVPWSPFRRADAITLAQGNIPVRPGTSYTLSFWAKGRAGVSVPVVLTGIRGWNQAFRYTIYVVTLHSGWYRYSLPYTPQAGVHQLAIGLQFGRAYGRSVVTGISLQRGQSLLFMRRFAHGLVLANESTQAALVRLPGRYWHLRGDQEPSVNDGQAVRVVWLPPSSGMILLNAPPGA